MKMNLTHQQLLSIATLCLVLGFIGSCAGLPSGVEFKKVKSCGKIRSNNSKEMSVSAFSNLRTASILLWSIMTLYILCILASNVSNIKLVSHLLR